MEVRTNIDMDYNDLDLDIPPSGQVAIGNNLEVDIAAKTAADVRKLNYTRLPLLTLIQHLKYGRDYNKPTCLNMTFSPNLGNAENHEALKVQLDTIVKESKTIAYNKLISSLQSRVDVISSQIRDTITENTSSLDITDPNSGEIRSKITAEVNKINDEFEDKVRKYVNNLRNNKNSNQNLGTYKRPAPYRKPNNDRPKKKGPKGETENILSALKAVLKKQ